MSTLVKSSRTYAIHISLPENILVEFLNSGIEGKIGSKGYELAIRHDKVVKGDKAIIYTIIAGAELYPLHYKVREEEDRYVIEELAIKRSNKKSLTESEIRSPYIFKASVKKDLGLGDVINTLENIVYEEHL